MTDDAFADITARLENWQRWRLGDVGNPLNYPGSSLADVHTSTRSYCARVPLQSAEAEETQRAVFLLPLRNRCAVARLYLFPELTQAENAAACGCSPRMLLRYAEEAKSLIKQHLIRWARRRRRESYKVLDAAPKRA